MIYLILTAVPLFLFAKWILFGDPKPVNGVYVQLGLWYPVKYLVFRILIALRRRRNAATHKVTSGEAGYGMRSRSTVRDMDKAQDLPIEQPLAVDAVYFNGADRNGNYLVAATARRQENIVQTILLIQIPGIGLMEHPSMPETNLPGTEREFAAGGLVIKPVKPMKSWHITFKGKLRLVETNELLNVKFNLNWTNLTKHFDFDTDMNPSALSGAVAREPWSRQFFDTLKAAHQTHYEQFGAMKGTIDIGNHGKKIVNLQGVRDHSYGNIRSWSDLHRYILQYVYTQDGRCLCFGAICMPQTMSRLTMGYIFHPDGRMDTLSSTSFEFYKLGDDGNPPKEFTVKFTAGSQKYEVKAKEVACARFFMGTEWGAKVHERMCSFTVNGVPAWGISEWEYKNLLGKKATITCSS